MRCTFIGVGSAFDEKHTNTSLLLEAGEKSVLLDCGFNSAHAFVRLATKPLELDAIWISHFHGDHFFGLPFLLGWFFSSGREKAFAICGPLGTKSKVEELLKLAYPNLLSKLSFDLNVHEFIEHDEQKICDFVFSSCKIEHSASALALRIDHGGKSIFYSGDGLLTADCEALAMNADFAVLESYELEDGVKGHSTIKKCLNFTKLTKIGQVALVHLEPFVRTCARNEIKRTLNLFKSATVILPKEGHVVEIS